MIRLEHEVVGAYCSIHMLQSAAEKCTYSSSRSRCSRLLPAFVLCELHQAELSPAAGIGKSSFIALRNAVYLRGYIP
jgi:hypothetical protein